MKNRQSTLPTETTVKVSKPKKNNDGKTPKCYDTTESGNRCPNRSVVEVNNSLEWGNRFYCSIHAETHWLEEIEYRNNI